MSDIILIIDDEVEFAELVGDAVKIAGYTPLIATSAKQALSLLSDDAILAVITDIVMPDMDGIELIREISKRKSIIPIILMSGFDSTYLQIAKTIGEAHELSVLGTLTKPFSVDEIVAQVRAIPQTKTSKS